ncbi:MAG: hypothetical protein C4K60_10465 [Ideonella sp. MAG2]|nr:MAG: hypothetical protein C4K60_10465 [Ideonella sp. MAG2]
MLPGDPGWDTEEACTSDSQFIAVKGTTNYLKTLLSRHVFCSRFVSDQQELRMDIMRTANGKAWEPYKKAAGRPAATCVVGWAALGTNFQAYDAAKQLGTPYKFRIDVLKFVRNSGVNKCPSAAATIVFQPVMAHTVLDSAGQVSNFQLNANVPRTGGMALSHQQGTLGTEQGFSAAYSWTAQEPASRVSFTYAPTHYTYRVNGAEPATGQEWAAYAGGDQGSLTVPTLRCDKGMATSTSSGCVFPDAAAVFVVDATKFPESAEHIRMAALGLSPGMTQRAPLGFKLLPGTRAVGLDDASQGSPSVQRSSKVENEASYWAACDVKNPDALILNRWVNASPGCSGSQPGKPVNECQCDEYPFGATRSGAAFLSQGTSVRYIAGPDNGGNGRALGNYITKQRILRNSDDAGERWWIVVK